jgi:hypothetical protein
MGDLKRLVALVVAIVGIGLSLLLPWWHLGAADGHLDISLRGAEMCAYGTCQEVKVRGAFSIVAIMTLAYGSVALLGLVFKGLLPALAGERLGPAPPIAGMLYLVLSGLTYGTMDLDPEVLALLGIDVEVTWAFWAGIVGASVALASPLLGLFDRSHGIGAGSAPYKPIVISKPASTPAPTLSPTPAAASSAEVAPPARRAPLPPIDLDGGPGEAGQGAHVAAEVPADGPAVGPADGPIDLPPVDDEVRVVDVPPLPPRSARVTRAPSGGVRFAVASAELAAAALRARGEDGVERALPWTDLAAAIARDLRGPPFPDDALMVDLIPRRGAPLRFLITSRLTFAEVAPAGASARDDLRRLLAFARAMHPDLEVEAATADFLYRRTPPPAWTAEELERYDARYRAG